MLYVRVDPGGASGKEPACQCKRDKRWGFNPRVGKIPWRRAWQPTLAWGIPWTEEAGGLHVHRVTKSQTGLKQLSMHTQTHTHELIALFHDL